MTYEQIVDLDENTRRLFDRIINKDIEDSILHLWILTATKDDTSSSDYYNARGAVRLELELYRNAIEDFDRCIESGNEEVRIKEQIYLSRGYSKLQLNLYHEAIRDFDVVLQINPNNYEAANYRNLAIQNINATPNV